jgi:hypothetical protein
MKLMVPYTASGYRFTLPAFAALLVLGLLAGIGAGYVKHRQQLAYTVSLAAGVSRYLDSTATPPAPTAPLASASAVTFTSAINNSSSLPELHDSTTGEQRLTAIRKRLQDATPCPWVSDGSIAGWWGGERPGVIVRSAANLRTAGSGYTLGGPVAEIGSDAYTGSRNPVADAAFIAHACEDIEYLLDELKRKGGEAASGKQKEKEVSKEQTRSAQNK